MASLLRTNASKAFRQSLARSLSTKANVLAPLDSFARRHIGPQEQDVKKMLEAVKAKSLDELIEQTVPQAIRAKNPLRFAHAKGESAALTEFQQLMEQNQVFRAHIGCGYYDTITPPVILRNIMENPLWYTAYTPYQAEISQGRMEMLLNYQTMCSDLTGLPVSNASLLDEPTAAAEAMFMCHAANGKNVFYIADDTHPQTIDVIKTRASGIKVEVRVAKPSDFDFSKGDVCGVLIQYPNTYGSINDYSGFADKVHEAGSLLVVASDLLALTMLRPPGEWGADCVVGSAQRFGVPMGFGGPHAAFFTVKDDLKRKMPGRVIGVSKDSRGKPALRLSLQTREQHIRRDKATSNICTAQALLANMAAAYAIYHGPEGLKDIAVRTAMMAKTFATGAERLGLKVASQSFFDTVHVNLNGAGNADDYVRVAHAHQVNIRKVDDNNLCFSFDETTNAEHVDDLYSIVSEVRGQPVTFTAHSVAQGVDASKLIPQQHARSSAYLTHPVFHSYHSETEMLRYLHKLASKDLSLATAMIPLGSCTMKLNATSEMIPVTWPTVGKLHPFSPRSQTPGYSQMLTDLEKWLSEITGFAAISLQPNAGSQGEYTGLMVIRAYHQSRGDNHRNICLIPTSAHGTNPASAVLAGMKVVVVNCDQHGNVDIDDLRQKAEQHRDNLSALMVTYPSTHGVFEEQIKEACKIIHDNGGQVYMDGANMNAQVGLCSPGEIGADVCHLNLHKTFCIPHGGGGPGMGPIGVAKQLVPFLPSHTWDEDKTRAHAIGPVAGAPFSSASILPISWMYLRMMGAEGVTESTKVAILSANYMMSRLDGHYKILYQGSHGRCAHEFIVDLREFKSICGITEEDVAKRLLDFNFHAPTMSFPVPGTLMIEPTESESLPELDRLCDAFITIRKEIQDVIDGKFDKLDNPLKGAPHTADMIASDNWNRKYSRFQAAYPSPYLASNKFWPTVGRLDNVYGDRNLVCTCPPVSSYN